MHQATIPCSTDFECTQLGTCGNEVATCASRPSETSENDAESESGPVHIGGTGSVAAHRSSVPDKVCTITSGSEPGPMCGWF